MSKSKKKSEDAFEKEIADVSAELSVKTITMDQLKDETKELEEKLTVNKTAMKSLKDDIKELAVGLDCCRSMRSAIQVWWLLYTRNLEKNQRAVLFFKNSTLGSS